MSHKRKFRSESEEFEKKRKHTIIDEATSREESESDDQDDTVGHYLGTSGNLINDRYKVQKEVGLGTFGKVFECMDLKYGDTVAVKVIRKIQRYVESAMIEADILDDVFSRQRKYKIDLCVKMFSHFKFEGHYCIVFERLGTSLYDFLKLNKYRGLPLYCVRDIARQLLETLDFLESMNLIHTDLKLENILFMDEIIDEYCSSSGRSRGGDSILIPRSTKIKVIDFGGATYDDEHKSTIINTRQYRGPEVTLEASWSFPSDVWGVGCMVAEIYSGELLFPTHDNLEHLAMMDRIMGPFPPSLLRASPVAEKYFHRDGSVRADSLSRSSLSHVRDMPSLRRLFSIRHEDMSSGIVELERELLDLDPRRRISAKRALTMPFFHADGRGRSRGRS